jgi:nucleoside phosphorylase
LSDDSNESIEQQIPFADVTIGILTALKEEYAACRGVFDPDESGVERTARATSGTFTAWLCNIQARNGGSHVVAISLLTDMGNNAAAIGANILLQHCPNVRFLIMCGIAGAVPHPDKPEDHVRLGDIGLTHDWWAL